MDEHGGSSLAGGGGGRSLHSAAVVAQHLALLAQVLGVLLALVGHVQAIRLLQGPLLVRVHVDVALDALLPHVGPGVPAHPLSLALGTLVLAEAALLALVWGQTLAFGACLGAVLDVVSFVETQVAQVVGRGPLAGLPGLRGQGQVGEVLGEGAEAVGDVVEGAVGRGALVHAAAQGLSALQLEEAVEIAGVQGRAQLLRAALAESQLWRRSAGGRLGPEGIEGARLVRVLQGQVDPVEQLGRLVHRGAGVDGRQQAHFAAAVPAPPRQPARALHLQRRGGHRGA